MKVVLFGASGMIGSRILAELISRGHKVTAVVRNPERVTAIEVQVIRGDLTDAASVASAVAGADAVLSAYAPPQGKEQTLLLASRSLVEGAEMAGVRRLLVVSGAGSLEVAEGVQLLDTPQFPAALATHRPRSSRRAADSEGVRSGVDRSESRCHDRARGTHREVSTGRDTVSGGRTGGKPHLG